MRLIFVNFFVAAALLGCEPTYGENPTPGDIPQGQIEQIFTDDFYAEDPQAGVTEGNILATYNYEPGKVCMMYGKVDSGPLEGSWNLSDVPVYTAQVFYGGEDEVKGPYYTGEMFKYLEEYSSFEKVAIYRFFPFTSPPQIIVAIENIPDVTVEPMGDDYRD